MDIVHLLDLPEVRTPIPWVQHAMADRVVFCSGMWLVLPTYMAYVLAVDILAGLAIASGDSTSTPARFAITAKEE